jgi:hypothetical protein
MFCKKQAKKFIFAPEIALRVERSDPVRNSYSIFLPTFQMLASSVIGLSATCGNIKPLYLEGGRKGVD